MRLPIANSQLSHSQFNHLVLKYMNNSFKITVINFIRQQYSNNNNIKGEELGFRIKFIFNYACPKLIGRM